MFAVQDERAIAEMVTLKGVNETERGARKGKRIKGNWKGVREVEEWKRSGEKWRIQMKKKRENCANEKMGNI